MTTRKNDSRVSELVEQIVRHKRAYYGGQPEISDQSYDKLEEELSKLSPNHPVLAMVGAGEESTFEKIAHGTPMLSLQKTYDTEDLLSWKKDQDLMATFKIDGVSMSLTYEDGALVLAKTRGNGKIGENVTSKVLWCPEVPRQLNEKINIEIRGELHCQTSRFFALSETMVKQGLEKPTNPRNIVAGVLGRKLYGDLTRYFSFFAFDVAENGPKQKLSLSTEVDKFKLLNKLGFHTPSPTLVKTDEELHAYIEQARHEAENNESGMDGVVFSYNDVSYQKELGHTSHHPRFKMVFKWAGETAESLIEDIKWATSRLGIVTPVAVIKPVYLSGAEITNISLHNAAYVTNFNLKPGDMIELIRSGEVIPKFLRVITSADGLSLLPKACSSCQSELVFDDVRLLCPNTSECPAQKAGSILNWIRCAGIDDLSEKRLLQMMDMGLVESIPDLYELTVEKLLTLPQTKEKLAKKLHTNIQASRNLPMENFLSGLGIAGMGTTSWLKILEHHPNFESLWAISEDDLVAIDGFAERTASQVVEGLKKTKPITKQLLKVGVVPKERDVSAIRSDHPLSGKLIAITGTLTQPRSQVEAALQAVGAKPTSSVSKNTFAVIAADPNGKSSKLKNARDNNIPIWSEDDLSRQLSE